MRRIFIILGTIIALMCIVLMTPNYLTSVTPELELPNVAAIPAPSPLPQPKAPPLLAPPASSVQTFRNQTEPSGGGLFMYKREIDKTDAILEQLESASMVFTIPDHANIKDTITVQLLIDPSKSLTEITEMVTINGVKTTKRIKVSKIIQANLTAPDFNIDAVTPEEQALTTTEPTEWLWKLTPETSGSHDVTVSVIAIVDIGDKSAMHHIKTYEQSVIIDIKASQLITDWFKKYWQWLFSTLIIPFAVWFYKNKVKNS